MSFYGNNTNALLYYGASTADPLPAPGADTFTVVPLLGKFTPPPNTLNKSFFSILNDAVRRSIVGRLGDRTVPFTVKLDWTLTPINTIYADSSVGGGRKRNWRIVYPDANNRQLDFAAYVTDWKEGVFDAESNGEVHFADSELTLATDITVTP